ncbi:MAG TPA: asparagine synthase (glutamine-hydrolyzing) [Chitinophagaceae bacterium]|nr:asparagine synthase (glutamine-hydrolyzing) [Chitinophagaceae bacterium]
MCGIAGIINKGNKSSDVAQMLNTLKKMTNALAHRGPDGEGYWINSQGNIGLGHRRLSIIDLSKKGAQPMHYLNRYSVIHNGEIYNYIELKETLQKKGYHFYSQSDTEIIAAAFDYWKEDCLHQFDGMFAFAIWDEVEQLLFLARDRFGEKPLYYFSNKDILFFASEMKALWASGVERKMNESLLLCYLTNGQLTNPLNPSETFYKDIYSLPAANYLRYHALSKELYIRQWWDLDKETTITIPEKEASETLLSLFSSSVSKRLRSDVELGTSLSGGIDSSVILATMYLQNKKICPKTFSAIFPGFEKDESSFIKKTLLKYPSPNFQVSPSANELAIDFERFLFHQEEPVQSASAYLQYKTFELAKKNGIKVLLDGQGADEILGGYTKYLHWYLQELLMKGKFKKALKEKRLLQSNYTNFQWGWKNYAAAFSPFHTSLQLQKKALLSIKQLDDVNPDFFHQSFKKEYTYKPVIHKLNDVLYYDTKQLLLPELLRYADRNSMSHGVEVRLPFLNHELVQFVFSLPAEYKIQNGFTKWVLRKSTEPLLTKEISWRKDKIGYEPPQQLWMQQPLVKEQIMEARKKLVAAGILKASAINNPVTAKAAYLPGNYDWRYLCASRII